RRELRDPARRLDARLRGDRRRRRARRRDGVHRRAALPALIARAARRVARSRSVTIRRHEPPGRSEGEYRSAKHAGVQMTRADAFGYVLSFVARLITGAQGHWKGCPPKAEQRIYFANHQSHFDWVLIWAALPRELRASTRPIAARDYWTATP